MNYFAKTFRCLPRVNSLVTNGGLISRSAAFKSDLKIKWVRPPKIASTMPEKSGDGGIDLGITPQDYVNYYDKSKELDDADEIVKKMFTLEFMPGKETRNKKREAILGMVQRHKADRGSMESRLAALTAEILYLQECMIAHPHNKMMKFFLKELIEKRKKFLGKLRRWDYRRFEWLLEKLNLVYKPNPDLYGNVTRKRSMRELTRMHCHELKLKKIIEYTQELQSAQANFFREKAEKLAFIAQEEISCGKEHTITEEEIAEAKRLAEVYAQKAATENTHSSLDCRTIGKQ